MTKLKNKYVIGCHVMFYEIEIYKEYIEGLINLLKTVDNTENIYLDLCFNVSEKIEKIDTDKISKEELIKLFKEGVTQLMGYAYIPNVKVRIVTPEDDFYFHADYRRDLNYNYCKKVDYIMHGETDSFFPKEAFQALESLSEYTNANNIHRYVVCFADRKMWDPSWDPTVHPKYINHVFEDGPDSHLNPNQAKSRMSIEDMNKINSEVEEFDFTYINEPKIDGSCLVLSADLIKFGVNIPSCLIYNDDHGLSIMSSKLLGKNYIQFVCKNLLKVHARRHPEKRLYVLNEDNPYSLGKKINTFEEFRRLSDANIQTLTSNAPNKFYEYKDFKHE
tara:strand:- start:100 stop:1098 length:999 start_codon:yes stop_codon:yes gene_type:complete